MINTLINGEWNIILPEHRSLRPEWKLENGGWERKRLDSMYKNIGKGDTLFYVGAEEGDMPALCQMWGAEIVMFEPNPKVWSNIKAIWEANDLETPYTFVGFASNETNYGNVIKGFPECADGEVISDHGFMELHNHNANEIKIDDISDLIPTALSIDVEGSEWEVLKGAEQTLRKHKPKIWLSAHPEFQWRMYGCYTYDMRNWIKDIGYIETLLDYNHEVHLYYESQK